MFGEGRVVDYKRGSGVWYTAGSTSPANRKGRGITAEEVGSTLKRAAARRGLDPSLVSTHSKRFGGATELINSGADRPVIQLMGRWFSNAFEGYPVLSADGAKDLSK